MMLKNKKGFTLVELMIVIAVIGILAVVLVPQIGGVKDQAKLAGLNVNAKVVQAACESLVDDYGGTDAECIAFRTALINRLQDPDYQVRNPFTGATLSRNWGAQRDTSVKVHFNQNRNDQSSDVHFLAGTANRDYAAGNIVVGITNFRNRMLVELYQYDSDGVAITNARTKISIK